MSKMKAGTRKEVALGETIRRELGSQSNRALLARLPAFKPDAELPETLVALLHDLERTEARTRRA